MTSDLIAVASVRDTCGTLFADHPEAVYRTAGEEWMTVEVPGSGESAFFMITRDRRIPGRYSIRMWPEGHLGDIEPGMELPGEITDVLTEGIPLRRGSRSRA